MPDGYMVQFDCKEKYQIKWNEVREVFAFKHDMMAYDLITLGFRTTDDGSWYEVWEDCPGYEQLVAEVERRFDIIDKEWWSKVAFPMLQPNRTTLWGEPMPWPDN